MTIRESKYRFLFAAGGTGGHLYPAIAVAQQLRILSPESQILFIGTKNKIESRVVPALGFNFKSIWISGFSRKFSLNNLLFPIKLIVSLFQSIVVNLKFKTTVAIGAGAYVAGPVLWSASLLGSKTMLLEQNNYPGITNRLLEKHADEIHISFSESEKYFREKDKLKVSGNPVRVNVLLKDKQISKESFALKPDKKVLLVLGGSLGAKTINQAIESCIDELGEKEIQIIWQTGALYYEEYKKHESDIVKVFSFIDDIGIAYSAADLIVARAGATTIAEAAYLGLPVIFVPSPNVAANHQFKNAEALAAQNAAELLEDKNASEQACSKILSIIFDESRLNTMINNIKKFSKPDAAKVIAESALRLAQMK